ncbi:response regulator [Ramlibacter sp. MMS24-I3-19]|uniref:response regulator n=1 Tax=Ramlibacter sp. MMS24-I3-19 TaxID=3416606 RepID=UPI003CFD9132
MLESSEHHYVDVIGFNEVERAMLNSVFTLAARRSPGFSQHQPGASMAATGPTVYLVDADQPAALAEFQVLHRRTPLPALLVGSSAHGTGLPVFARPLQWARLLQALDEVVEDGTGVTRLAASNVGTLRATRPGSSPTVARSGAGRAGPESLPARRPGKESVLVVDDNATVRSFMQAKLAPFGFGVDFAETGEAAIGLSGQNDYTCVFLDVVLPGVDGYQVCKMIKSNKQAITKTAVVMLTSRSSTFDKLRGSLAGCDEYLTKPLEEDRLLEVIAKFLPSSRRKEARK